MDDQAETILLRLVAGSGVGGLGGMRPSTDLGGIALVRPLLGLRKEALEAYCRAEGLTPVDDPSNADPRYGRARIRRILPLLAAEGLTVERLARLGERAAAADAALDAIAAEAFASAGGRRTECIHRLDWRKAADLPSEIRLRLLLLALGRSGEAVPPLKLEAVERLASEIGAAGAAGARLRRTIAGRMVTLKADGALLVGNAPPRRTG